MASKDEAVRRQVVNFSFFKLMPEWRRLPRDTRREHRQELAEVLHRWEHSGEVALLTYSLVGLRAEADIMFWRICYSLECLQAMTSDINRTALAGYLQKTASFLGTTRHSQYLIPGNRSDERYGLHGAISPGGAKYLALYPYTKTRNWYTMPFEARQNIVREHLNASLEFPTIKANLIFSFGLDDQEFIMAAETNDITHFTEAAMRLREVDNFAYVQRDTPIYTCVRTSVEEALETLG